MKELLPGKTSSGNTWLPLITHLKDTEYVMGKLYDEWLPKATKRYLKKHMRYPRSACRKLGYLHDIGKATPYFVFFVLNNPDITAKLKAAGFPIKTYLTACPDFYHNKASECLLKEFDDSFNAIIGSHHGSPIDKQEVIDDLRINRNKYRVRANDEWEAAQKEIISAYKPFFEKLDDDCQMILSGLLIVADWLASNVYFFPLIDINEDESVINYSQRHRRAWKKINFPERWEGCDIKSLFVSIFKFKPNSLQKEMLKKNRTGLTIIESEMGSGKTEAGLIIATQNATLGYNGLYFGLPTQATSNAMYSRIVDWAKGTKLAPALLHGMAPFNEEYIELINKEIVNPSFRKKTGLLTNCAIGTIDQLLMSGIQYKHAAVRHLGMCGKTIVIDEAHSYDLYMSQYLYCVLSWLGKYNTPVVILSATLTNEKRKELFEAYLGRKVKSIPKGYPLITWTEGNKIKHKVMPITYNKTIEMKKISNRNILSNVPPNVCTGVIVNNVSAAQDIYEDAVKRFPEKETILLHAHYRPEERAEIEKKLIRKVGKHSKNRNNVLVIGTQVLEQSLDIDFDFLITELCPIDLMLQRIGRLFRHQRNRAIDKPTCLWFDPLNKTSKKIYTEWLIHRTAEIMPDEINIPKDIPKLIENVYEATSESGMYKEFKAIQKERETKGRVYTLKNAIKGKPVKFRRIYHNPINFTENDARKRVRDGEDTIKAILLRDTGSAYETIDGKVSIPYKGKPSAEEARELYKNQVPIGLSLSNQKSLVCKEKLWTNRALLKDQYYLILDNTLHAEFTSGSTLIEISYDKEYGLRTVWGKK